MRKASNLLAAEPLLTLTLPDFHHVSLTLVGCGGTGSHIASGLVSIVQALDARHVTSDVLFIDPDTVESKNIGRQLFSLADVGKSKARVLAERMNGAFGVTVGCAVRKVDSLDGFGDGNGVRSNERTTRNAPAAPSDRLCVVIGAVDNAAARQVIAARVEAARNRVWWLDCGSENHSGQVALGNCTRRGDMVGAVALGMIGRLPAPHLMYPDLVKDKARSKSKSRRAPSCADLAADGTQGLMVNRMAAAWACALLHDLLVTRSVRWFAAAFDLRQAGVRGYALDAPTVAEAAGIKVADLLKR